MSCPCAASYDPSRREHYVWLAFLQYDNDDDEYRTTDIVSPWTKFINRATCLLDWTNIIHCQVFFWNNLQKDFISFSIDAVRNQVFMSERKLFRRGWLFQRISVTAAEEIAMYNFFLEQLARHATFDYIGSYALLFIPVNTGNTLWFCSKLVVAALHRAGLLKGIRSYATSPASLYTLASRHLTGVATTNPVRR